MFSVKFKLCAFHKHYSNIRGLRTSLTVHNFSVHKIVLYMTCTETWYTEKRACKFSKFETLNVLQ